MAETKNKTNENALVTIAGVIKFDHRKFGYPQIAELAKKWAKDNNFVTIIIRAVSQKNYGIQFVFQSKDISFKQFYDKYIKPVKQYEYAYDISATDNIEDIIKAGIIKTQMPKSTKVE